MARSDRSSAKAEYRRERPVLVDRFLEDAVEVDVDALRDSTGEVLIAGVMEHVEEAGVHSGDSACALPPQTLSTDVLATIEQHTRAIAAELSVVGLVNVQYRGQRRRRLRARGESASEPHRAVRSEGDRCPGRDGGSARDARVDARRRCVRKVF